MVAKEETFIELEKTNTKKNNRNSSTSTSQPNKKFRKAVLKETTPLVEGEEASSVVYIGRIPHGFYEDQMKAYFEQFGKIVHIRISRNKKTGASKHYGFIEFENEKVSAIVAKTMDKYLIFDTLLQCRVVPKSKIHEDLWVGSDSKFKVLPWDLIERQKHNKTKTEEEVKKQMKRLKSKELKRREKLSALGIKYDFKGYFANEPSKTTTIIAASKPSPIVKRKRKLAEPRKA